MSVTQGLELGFGRQTGGKAWCNMRTDIYSTHFSHSFLSFCLALHLTPLCSGVVQHSLQTACVDRGKEEVRGGGTPPCWRPLVSSSCGMQCVYVFCECAWDWCGQQPTAYMALTLQRAQGKTGLREDTCVTLVQSGVFYSVFLGYFQQPPALLRKKLRNKILRQCV